MLIQGVYTLWTALAYASEFASKNESNMLVTVELDGIDWAVSNLSLIRLYFVDVGD